MDSPLSTSLNEPRPDDTKAFVLKDLLDSRNIDWAWINKIFKSDPLFFEELLFRIHYKRNKLLPPENTLRILIFLSTGYLTTNDVRYFNEFLWFYKENEHGRDLINDCIERFNSNLDKEGCHRLSLSIEKLYYEVGERNLSETVTSEIPPLRICLIGFPPFFSRIIKSLRNEGHYVEQFFLPHHPNRLINKLLKLKLPVKLLSILKGNVYTYRTLKYDVKDERIGKILKDEKFDIGFHKLNFIIRQNIFNSFRLGLLNDHWGYLPLLRGKSTIAYSLLLGIPVVSTVHFINEGIDSGPIIGYQSCNYTHAGSVDSVRKIIRREMPERIINAIKLAGSREFIPKENKKAAGVTFYEMHPWLNNHINSRILNN